MVEEEVEIEVVGINLNALLPSEEGEAGAEFEEEGLDLTEDGVFDIFFEVAVAEAEEVKDIGVAKDEVGG